MAWQLFLAAAAAGVKSYAAGKSIDAKAAQNDSKAYFYDKQAALETISAEYDVARHRDATSRVIGKQRNAYLGMGFSLDGTPSDVMFDTLTESEKDVYAIRLGARIKADNYRADADNERAQATSARQSKRFSMLSPFLDLAGNAAVGKAATSLGQSIYASLGSSGGGNIPYAPDDI